MKKAMLWTRILSIFALILVLFNAFNWGTFFGNFEISSSVIVNFAAILLSIVVIIFSFSKK